MTTRKRIWNVRKKKAHTNSVNTHASENMPAEDDGGAAPAAATVVNNLGNATLLFTYGCTT